MIVLLIYFYNIVIQGTADLSTNITQDELSKTADFSFKTFQPAPAEQREAVLETLKAISTKAPGSTDEETNTGHIQPNTWLAIFGSSSYRSPVLAHGRLTKLLSIRDAISKNGKICSV